MTTLHDLLKDGTSAQNDSKGPRVDLRGNYSKLGLSAVAAAARYGSAKDEPVEHKTDHYPSYWPKKA